jgi:hypothetical protein
MLDLFVQPVASFEMLTRRMRFRAAVGGDAIFEQSVRWVRIDMVNCDASV